MKLIKVKVHGYRRFKEPSEMHLDGKLIAIVGPNEAGKSSFLRALLRLNDQDEIVESGGSQELTRGMTFDQDHIPILGTFLLEDIDREAIRDIPGCEGARWFTVSKRIGGNFFITVTPTPKRPLKSRQNLVKSLRKVLPKIKKHEAVKSYDLDYYQEVETLADKLTTDVDTLTEDVRSKMTSLSESILASGIASEIDLLQSLATDLIAVEQEEAVNLHGKAANRLFLMRPKFILFGPSEINLLSDYGISVLQGEIPVALANLARLAGLNLAELAGLIDSDDQGQIETITRNANERLRAFFENAWSQSNLDVQFRVSGSVLSILVGERGASYVRIAERSDGLRRYVALVAFMQLQESDQRPILLIDEAETHLHYDAQADLVQMLAQQDLAAKVIYTTHSIGCLPEDLGSGVRQVEAVGSGYSRIQNWFWEGDSEGFSPLLFGMGAETLAFVPIRYALVAEGAADMILLPRLFREACGLDHLGFQIVPGLSEADENRIIMLEKSSPRTVYLGDADKGGKGLISQVRRAGVPDERVFLLPDPAGEGLISEDFLDASVYANAVNEELRRSHGEMFRITELELGSVNRPGKLDAWCKKNRLKSPSKRAVAYRVIEMDGDEKILSSKKRRLIAKLVADIHNTLDISFV